MSTELHTRPRVVPRPAIESHDAISRPSARRLDFDAAWRRYCDVIRELEMTAAELEALRNRE